MSRTFVLQLHADADPQRGVLTGRVEHVPSGDATHFQALDELLVFIARALAVHPATPAGRDA